MPREPEWRRGPAPLRPKSRPGRVETLKIEIQKESGSVQTQTNEGQVAESTETLEYRLLIHEIPVFGIHGRLARTGRSLMLRN